MTVSEQLDAAAVNPAAVLAAVTRLLPALAEAAEDADRHRSLSPSSALALRRAGAHRLLQPAAYGGAESSVSEHVRVAAKAGEGCVAAGWCVGLWGVHNWMMAHFGTEAPEAAWADPSNLISGSIVPREPFPDDGADHILVQGRFGFASGSDHADWLLIGGKVSRGGGEPVPAMAVVPRATVHIDQDSWDVVALRGSGSKDPLGQTGLIAQFGGVVERAHTAVTPQRLNLHRSTPHCRSAEGAVTAGAGGETSGSLHRFP